MKYFRVLTVILLIIVLMLPLSACKRFDRSGDETYTEDEENQEEINNEISKTNEEAEEEQEGENNSYLVPMVKNDGKSLLYGYSDGKGNTVIQPQFKFAEPFYDCGIAVVTDINGKCGLIDKTGSYIVNPEHDYFYHSEDLFITFNNDMARTTAFNEKGEKMFEIPGYVNEFSDGLSPYYSEASRGYIDKSGNMAITLNYDSLGPFINGIAEVSETYGEPAYYIDTKGNDVTDKVSSGLRVFKDASSGLFGYKNSGGEAIISARYSEAWPFNNGNAIVNGSAAIYDTQYGIIDTEGNYVLEPKYCGIQRLKNGLIAVGEEIEAEQYIPAQYFYYSKKALFTADLKEHTDWLYYSADNFDENNVCVNDEDSIYFLDKKLGQSKNLPNLKGMGYFNKDGDFLRGDYNHLPTIVDKAGNILFRGNEKIDLGDGIEAIRNFKTSSRTSVVAYPVISGIKDKDLENKINTLISQEMVDPYSSSGYEEPYYLEILEAGYVLSRQKDLLLIDQDIYMYALGGAHGGSFRNTVYIDLIKGRIYVLNDLLKAGGEGYTFLSEAVSAIMKEKMDEVGYWEDHVTITPDTGFALAEDGIILYFAEYEIASYAAGMQEFLIPYSDLMPYIDTEGDFWKSFN